MESTSRICRKSEDKTSEDSKGQEGMQERVRTLYSIESQHHQSREAVLVDEHAIQSSSQQNGAV